MFYRFRRLVLIRSIRPKVQAMVFKILLKRQKRYSKRQKSPAESRLIFVFLLRLHCFRSPLMDSVVSAERF